MMRILRTEVTHISLHGIWLLVEGTEYFLSYEDFPWFKKGSIEQVLNVQLLHDFHLHWPDLDVDLELESLNNLEKHPLLYR